jgi:hypothetical protein
MHPPEGKLSHLRQLQSKKLFLTDIWLFQGWRSRYHTCRWRTRKPATCRKQGCAVAGLDCRQDRLSLRFLRSIAEALGNQYRPFHRGNCSVAICRI